MKLNRRTLFANGFGFATALLAAVACRRQGTVELDRAIGPPSSSTAASAPPAATPANPSPPSIATRPLGNRGVELPLFGLGCGKGPFASRSDEADAIALAEAALQLGITYFDTAPQYGPSEGYLGKVLPPHRDRLFLASKTEAHDRDGAWRELERSLQRLGTDHLDLWQLHHISFMEELDRLGNRDGAVQAVIEAREQGVIRFAGITGHHDPAVIAEGLRRFPLDATLIPVNAVDRHQPDSFIDTVLPVVRTQQVGAIAMKVPAYGRLIAPAGPLPDVATALRYSLSHAGVTSAIIGADTFAQVQENAIAAAAVTDLDSDAMAAIERLTADHWQGSSFYRAWT